MRKSLLSLAIFVTLFVATLIVLSGPNFAGGESHTRGLFAVIGINASIAFLWILAAGGYGSVLRSVLSKWIMIAKAPGSSDPFDPETLLDRIALELPLGICVLLLLDTWMGTLGVLAIGNGLLATCVLIAGAALWIRALRNAVRDGVDTGVAASIEEHSREQLIAIAAVLGVVLALGAIAASSTPLWLWSSEFGGYDALSYHLEFPKQWMLAGQSSIVDGNVYSHLPGYVEHAFLHVMTVRGNPWDGAYACQFLSAFFALTTVFVSWRLARALLPQQLRALAFLAPMLLLTLPWLLVVGTLAYNDSIPLLMLGAGWFILARYNHADPSPRRVLDPIIFAIALIAAIACGAKPTALFFTALPLAALVLLRYGFRATIELPLACGVGVFVLLPWFLKNYSDTSNPVFPFATGMFGLGAWTQSQADTFTAAHMSTGSFVERITAYWQEFLSHGFGERPRANEPWFPQWGVLPILGIVCSLALMSTSLLYREKSLARSARWGALLILLIQSAAWMSCTHLKSRFMLPAAMPLAIAATLALAPFLLRYHLKTATACFCVALAVLPAAVFLREPARNGVHAPAAFVDSLAQAHGDSVRDLLAQATTKEEQATIFAMLPSTILVDEILPKNAQILALGLATPFHYRRTFDSTTVWDRGAMEEIASEHKGHPEVWRDALTARGYTHLIVQPTMLEVWRNSGWLAPELDVDSLRKFVQTLLPVMRCADGVIVFVLEAPPNQPPIEGFTPSSAKDPPSLLTPQ